MQSPKVFFFLVLMVYGSSGAPQVYQATNIQEFDGADLGPFGAMVSYTMDLLPEIMGIFEDDINNPSKNDPLNPSHIGRFALDWIPNTRRIMTIAAESQGRRVAKEHHEALNAAEVVMPTVWSFMDRLRDMNFLNRRTIFPQLSDLPDEETNFLVEEPAPPQPRGRNVVEA
ncbi:hypothetical protein SK128_013398 [Halocaridina rubra]|uniref:Uncharacterized protein n=1 Tax=Halocaridina rubra TaxID=373956 RepID=A0AAN9A7V7_HALRR